MGKIQSFLRTTLLLLYNAGKLLACHPGGYYYYYWVPPPNEEETTLPPKVGVDSKEDVIPANLSKIKNDAERNQYAWKGWNPPPHIAEDWKAWLYNHQLKTNNTDYVDPNDKETSQRLEKERGRGSGWPKDWTGMEQGIGQEGANPPPWAYAPKEVGKPEYCYLPLKFGVCKKPQLRWAYNPYLEQCINFTWSGCGNNANNFATRLICVEKCAAPAPAGCDSDSHLYPADLGL